jgi:oleandomycin transport system permease protein
LPISRSAPLVGAVLADFARYLILCAVFFGFGSLIGFRIQTGPVQTLAAIVVIIAFALCFCWVSVFVGMIARTAGAVQGIMFLIVLPLSFGSNTFVDTATMPGWLQAFVKANPITHLVDTVRGLLLGGPVAGPLAWTLVWMAALLAVFVPLALRGYRRHA